MNDSPSAVGMLLKRSFLWTAVTISMNNADAFWDM